MDEPLGKVTIAPNVLATIVRQTALEQRGVRRLSPIPPRVRPRVGVASATEAGLYVIHTDQGAQVEVHVAAEHGVNLLHLGEALQCAIVRAIEEMLGLEVAAVDVYIDEVDLETLPASHDH